MQIQITKYHLTCISLTKGRRLENATSWQEWGFEKELLRASGEQYLALRKAEMCAEIRESAEMLLQH